MLGVGVDCFAMSLNFVGFLGRLVRGFWNYRKFGLLLGFYKMGFREFKVI